MPTSPVFSLVEHNPLAFILKVQLTFGLSAKFPLGCDFLEEIKKNFGRGQEASAYYKMLLLASDPNTQKKVGNGLKSQLYSGGMAFLGI